MDSLNKEFCLPDLGEGLPEAELVEWCVCVGDHVQENDIVAKVETAKALVDVRSPRSGTIAALHGRRGQTIKVGSPLVTYEEQTITPTVKASSGLADSTVTEDAGTVVGSLTAICDEPAGKVLAAPGRAPIARELGVEIENIQGTGIGGRVTSRDVEAACETKEPRRTIAGSGSRPQRRAAEGSSVRIPLRGVRKTVAEHLRYSVSHAIHYTVMDEVDVTELDALRRRLSAASPESIRLLPFVACAVCRAVTIDGGKEFGRLNSTFDDDTQEIVQYQAVHLGIATDTDNGLMVPVIRDADRMGVLELNREIARLAQAARDRTIMPDKLRGSTFTVSNFGSLAGRFGTPIINYPEAAILGVGRAHEGAVVHQGTLVVGKLLPLSLSADHRVVDGATAAGALGKIMELLRAPQTLLPEAVG